MNRESTPLPPQPVYPAELEHAWPVPGGPILQVRPLRPDDLERELQFIRGLSQESLYQRMHYVAREIPSAAAVQLLATDYVNSLALAAVDATPAGDEFVGVSRYARIDDTDRAECAVVVADAWQGRGVGTELMRSLAYAARARGITKLVGQSLGENRRIAAWAQQFGCPATTEPNSGGLLQVTLDLSDLPA
ncbi:MAG TPA: GNAT family N-acetyltransferase [Steroidobacteraceae bacterium]